VTALNARMFRLVAHVDRPTAERLANEARALELFATVHPEREPTDFTGWLLSRWWALIPLMWIAFPPLSCSRSGRCSCSSSRGSRWRSRRSWAVGGAAHAAEVRA